MLTCARGEVGRLETNYSVAENVLSNSPLQSQMVTAQEVKTQM